MLSNTVADPLVYYHKAHKHASRPPISESLSFFFYNDYWNSSIRGSHSDVVEEARDQTIRAQQSACEVVGSRVDVVARTTEGLY